MSFLSSSSSFSHSCFFLICFFYIFAISSGAVPPSKTFKFINQGEFGSRHVEKDANYRELSISTDPFSLCFYNTTPNDFILALKMGSDGRTTMRWVWEANLAIPVRENATLTFGRDGNLVLADFDGRVVWQTRTVDKGVVGFKLLPNGNMVLHDRSGKFIWQSFDHPTDTLLMGQALRRTGPTKLENGPYSLVMESTRLSLYLRPPNSPKPVFYSAMLDLAFGPLEIVEFTSVPETGGGSAYQLRMSYAVTDVFNDTRILSSPKYDSTFSFLRIDSDGDLKMYTYYDKIENGDAWEVTFSQFSRELNDECWLPTKCGSLGICENNQCVACPRPQGLMGWSSECAPPKLPPCNQTGRIDYYKVDVGVDSFLNRWETGEGPMKLIDCRKKCSRDCQCLGFFYETQSSKCFVAPTLGSLIKRSDAPSHLGFIKVAK